MKNIFFFSLILLLFNSCEEIVELDLRDDDSDFYVVEGQINNLDGAWVQISISTAVAEEKLPHGVSNAIVTIKDDQTPVNSVVLTEDASKSGFYTVPAETSYFGYPGRSYTLNIEVGDEIITATDYLAPVEPIDSINAMVNPDYGSYFISIISNGQEPQGLGDFYKWDILINDTLVTSADYLTFYDDEFVDGNYMDSLEVFVDFHDPADTTERLLQYGYKVQVRQKSLSEFVYDFHYEVVSQSFKGGLFSVPAANLHTNLKSTSGKNVLGIFMAHDISESNILYIDNEIMDQLESP